MTFQSVVDVIDMREYANGSQPSLLSPSLTSVCGGQQINVVQEIQLAVREPRAEQDPSGCVRSEVAESLERSIVENAGVWAELANL